VTFSRAVIDECWCVPVRYRYIGNVRTSIRQSSGLASPAFAADPVVGTWKLNVAKSKFSTGAALTAGTRVYAEANGLYTLEQKLTGADGKERSNRVQYRDGKEEKQATAEPADTTLAKKIDANTWDFDLKKDGKVRRSRIPPKRVRGKTM
jgi:hypothetical protein